MLLSFVVISQSINTLINDTIKKRPVLVDFLDREGLQSGEFAESYTREYASYQPDNEIIDQLKIPLKDVHVIIVLGTWCGDSKDQVPRFLKILDKSGFETEKCTLIGVDSQKSARDIDVSVYDIERVPTFIFYRDEVEIGRIVETPSQTLESDALKICLSNMK